jgi:beta-glucosidase
LVGFQRIALQPGERRLITFTLSTDQLKMVMEDGTKRLLKGTYRLTLAGAAPCNRAEELGVPQCSVSFKL